MGSDYYFGYYFYAPSGRFEPCGMHTLPHIAAVILCFALLVPLTATKIKAFARKKEIISRRLAVVLTLLETIKIAHSFIYGDLNPDSWVPLSYCGLFIFALWMYGYGRKNIKICAECFIAYGCPVAGIAFLLFPTTSLMIYPVWHFFSVYSLFFHSAMIFVGIIFLSAAEKLNIRRYVSYILFITVFSVPAVICNLLLESNFMNLRMPYNIPIAFLQRLYADMPFIYTLLVMAAYFVIPALVEGIRKTVSQN